MKNTLDFLAELRSNNDRDWFQTNKFRYEAAKSNMEKIAAQLISGIHEFDRSISNLNPKDTLFRIYRDVRFSHDKSPYKTNIGSFIVKGGKKSNNAGYYLHIEPEGSFLGGGIHMPPADILRKIREEIYVNSDTLNSILNNKNFQNHFGSISSDKLSRPPKGFDADFKDIELLKFKSFTVFRNVSDEECLSENLVQSALSSFREMEPFISFLNKAIEE
ncbi:DUF2461 domain-containing protein [Bacteroidota bacterium]